MVKSENRRSRLGLQDELPYLDSRMRRKPARDAFAEAGRIIHHMQWQYRAKQVA